ncbi:SDR family NAD(P)-dependent oxidoreductase [Candidatus Omnitrophota bacterium]
MSTKQVLCGKKAVIIGGTSGLGEAIACAFVKEGATVIPVSRDSKKVLKTLTKLKKLGNFYNDSLTVNVCNEKQVKLLVKKVDNKKVPVDIVVCTAGMYLKKDFLSMKTTEWNALLETNLTGTYLINKHFGQAMVKRRSGSIINISSLGARVALSKATAYCVSKAGVSMLTKSLACEWATTGVRVNAILPGVFLTPLNKKALSDTTRRKNILAKTPLKRLGKLSEITSAALFLASDAASFVTGTEVTVDGGFLATSGF